MQKVPSSRWRARTGGTVLAAVGLFVLTAGPAAATDEFPADPGYTVETRCSSDLFTQAELVITTLNTESGMSSASIHVTVSTGGVEIQDYVANHVPGDSSQTIVEIEDDQEYTVTVDSSPQIQDETTTVSKNCAKPPTAALSFECTSDGPFLTLDVESLDPAGYDLTLGDGVNEPQALEGVVGAYSSIQAIPEDAVAMAEISYESKATGSNVQLDELAIDADCTQPAAVVSIDCATAFPTVDIELAGDDLEDLTYEITDGSTKPVEVTVPAGTGDKTVSHVVSEGEAVDIEVTLDGVVVGGYDDTADCAEIVVLTDVTTPPTVPDVVPAPGPTTIAATGTLPVTGTNSTLLAIVGISFLSLGLTLVRLTRRAITRGITR